MPLATLAAYEELTKVFARLYSLTHCSSLMMWDEMVNMPAGGAAARGAAKAELKVISHELITSKDTAALFDAITANNDAESVLSVEQQANLREMRVEWDKSNKLPSDHVKEFSLAASKAQSSWAKARPANDWNAFLPELKEVFRLAKKEGELLMREGCASPYEALLDKWERGMTVATMDRIYGDIKSWLPGLLQDILKTNASRPKPKSPQGPFSVEKQRDLGQEVMDKLLHFDFNHGRLDISKHPFCGGTPEDVRLTTRYDENAFEKALMATIHETGHSRYEQNRPADPWRNQPVSSARSFGVHESQSLFHEMQIARSPAFMKQLSPLLVKHLGGNGAVDADAFTPENLVGLYTEVNPGFIRVYADEVCYTLHVLLRYEIESAIFAGKAEVEDIPILWDEKMKEYLGIDTTGNFQDGPLQDIHWSIGYVGFFATYTIGAVYAAQLMAAVRRDLGTDKVDAMIAEGKMDPIFDWLKTKVWNKGSFIATGEELLKEATGEPINVDYYRKHLTERYLTRQ